MREPKVLERSVSDARGDEVDAGVLHDRGMRTAVVHSRAADVVAVVALFLFGLVIRRHVLPRDGLLFDDAWVVLGAKGPSSNLLSVTTLQPGFTALLKPWRFFVSGRTELMAFPSVVVGAGSGSVLYLVLRRWSVTRAVAFAISLLLVAAPVAVMYSGRVKPYVFEIVIVTLLAAALPRLAARSWSWPMVALWACGSVALSSFSAYTVPAVVGAGVVLVLHPDRDAVKRWSAVGLQLAATAVYLRQVDGSFDAAGTNRGWEQDVEQLYRVPDPAADGA